MLGLSALEFVSHEQGLNHFRDPHPTHQSPIL
ncbi:Uncharacterised protein [Vibrio cholerae]|nr:Uncharacterised protein [Vibrio cholerae]